MEQRLKNLQNKLSEAEASQKIWLESKDLALADVERYNRRLESATKARVYILNVATATQNQLGSRISTIVSSALAAVFDDPYEFKIKFVERRNKTECDLLFVKNGEEMNPIDSSGGGPIDVASFALRLAFWNIIKGRNVLILDEPFKFVSLDLQDKCSAMLKDLSDKLGIQIIMASHLPEIISKADKIFRVDKKGVVEV